MVVLTHGKRFKSKCLREYLDDIPDDDGVQLTDTIGHRYVDRGSAAATAASKIASSLTQRRKISLKKFLKYDMQERVMAVENSYETEYPRNKQRDAVIELIDVVVAANNGKCFRNKFFDIVQNRLKERDEKEVLAKKEFLQDERNEYEKAKKAVSEEAEKFANAYIKEIQHDICMEQSMERISKMVELSLKELKTAASTMIELARQTDATDPLENIVIIEETIREKNKETQEQANIHPAHRSHARLQKRLQDTKVSLTESGLKPVECELGLEYSLIIAQLLYELNEEETSKYVDIHTMLLQHLKAFLDALLLMEEISKGSSQNPSSLVIGAIIDKAVITQVPLIMSELMETTEMEKWMKDLEHHQIRRQQEFDKDKGDHSFLEKYYRKTQIVRQWAKEAANLIIKSANEEELITVSSSIYFESPSEVLEDMISLTEEQTIRYTRLATENEETTTFVSAVTSDLLTKIAKEALVEIFTQRMTDQDLDKRRKFMVRAMTNNVYPCISKLNNNSGEEDYESEALRYEDARLHILYATEFLVNRCFTRFRKEVLQQELQNKESRGKQSIREIVKANKYFKRLKHIDQSNRTVQNSLEEKCRQQLLEIEGDLLEKNVLERELEGFQIEERAHTDYLITCIDDSVESLFVSVRNEIAKFIMKKTPIQLKQLEASGYQDVVDEVSSNVEQDLGPSSKAYFGKNRIDVAIRTYAKVNQEGLQKIVDEVGCVPADSTVTEKTRGNIQMSGVKVGDQLLTSSSDGTLTYHDVFMLGAFCCVYLQLSSCLFHKRFVINTLFCSYYCRSITP